MILATTLLLTGLSSGLVLLGLALHDAPEGFEDENGFQVLWRNNEPTLLDVACVWTVADSRAA